MNWDNLPDDIIRKILYIRREITCGNGAAPADSKTMV